MQGRNLKWEDMAAAPEVAGVIEAVVREAQVVHVAEVPEQEHQVSRSRVAIIVPIMTDPADYIPVIQIIETSEQKVPGILGRYLHCFL